jgi:hypothetical protein
MTLPMFLYNLYMHIYTHTYIYIYIHIYVCIYTYMRSNIYLTSPSLSCPLKNRTEENAELKLLGTREDLTRNGKHCLENGRILEINIVTLFAILLPIISTWFFPNLFIIPNNA